MYLVAIKSVYTKIGEGRICVINDGTLTREGIDLLKTHLPSLTMVDMAAVDTGPCPRGGCWERLFYIVDLTRQNYVIQVDSDILAREGVPEVVQCYRENRSFTLGTWAGQKFVNLIDASNTAKAIDSNHIQIVAERSFDRLPDSASKRYVRGSAGFAGYSRGLISRREAEEFSVNIQRVIGSRWSEWGSEQVTSNYLVSNSERSCVLPWPKYTNFSPHVTVAEASLLHFVGDWRFYRGRYASESKRIIARLM